MNSAMENEMKAYMVENINGSFCDRQSAENAIKNEWWLVDGDVIKVIEFDWAEQKMTSYEVVVSRQPYDEDVVFKWNKVGV